MKNLPWLIVVAVAAVYVALIYLFGYAGPIALTLHFARIAVVMAVLILYFPAIRNVFKTVPAPYRDYLLAGIILTELSNESFSAWNEAGRVYGVDTSVFTSPISGFFSLLLVLGGVAFLKAADTEDARKWIWALVIAVVFSTILVFVVPTFR